MSEWHKEMHRIIERFWRDVNWKLDALLAIVLVLALLIVWRI